MTSIATFPTTLAQFVQNLPGLSSFDVMSLFSSKEETALNRAFAQFYSNYRNEVDALFDEHFLTHAGEPILNDFVAYKLDRHEAATQLAQVWSDQLGPVSGETRRRRIRDVAMAADALLKWFQIELGRPQVIDHVERAEETGIESSSQTLTLTAVETAPGTVHLSAAGKLNADSYMEMIHKAQEHYRRGVRNLELDLGNITDVQMSGLYALHCIAKIFRGEEYPDRSYGIAGLRNMVEDNLTAGVHDQLRLCAINSAITKRLEKAGIYEVYAV